MTRSPTPTILEVAREAGVSKTSVSRYLGGERDRLSPSMQTRIATAITSLGYRPNWMARGLKGGQSRLLGMLVADIRNPFSTAVLHGAEQACRAHGLSLLVCNTDNDAVLERRHLEMLAAYRVEGMIINAAGDPGPALRRFADPRTPVVLLDRQVSDLDADIVGLDNALAIDQAFAHLHAQGYRRLLYVSEPVTEASSRQARLARVEACLARHPEWRGETLGVALEAPGDALATRLRRFVDSRDPAPGAILCANGQVTLAVAQWLREAGVTLGPVGLMGIDELDWCALVGPGITTLAQPTATLGASAVDCLVTRFSPEGRQRPPRRLDYAGTLIPRGSTRRDSAPAPTTDFRSLSCPSLRTF